MSQQILVTLGKQFKINTYILQFRSLQGKEYFCQQKEKFVKFLTFFARKVKTISLSIIHKSISTKKQKNKENHSNFISLCKLTIKFLTLFRITKRLWSLWQLHVTWDIARITYLRSESQRCCNITKRTFMGTGLIVRFKNLMFCQKSCYQSNNECRCKAM